MKPDQLEMIGDAVVDAIKLQLPALVRDAVASNLEAAVAQLASKATAEREHVIREAVAATMNAHEARIAEFRRLDETVLAKMREELDRLRVEFDDGLQAHYAETRRELELETARSVATALMDRRDGPPGPPGRDGSFACVVHWAAGAHIARGSVVQHRGGLWFANVDSDVAPGEACSGYTLMLDGFGAPTVESDSDGYLVQVWTFASGRVERVRMYRPDQYAGIHDAERAYLPGDLVTCEGSLWRARAPNDGLRPGTDKGAGAWQLVVKRGKDGRDGTDGMQGPAGERGPPGAAAPATKRANGSAP